MERKGKKWYGRAVAFALALSCLLSGCTTGGSNGSEAEPAPDTNESTIGNGVIDPIVVEKSEGGNPITGFGENGELTYGGDPAVLVDGDTVYLYTGHDVSISDGYAIPEYLCYSTKDLKHWTYEGVVMKMTDVTWADRYAAWAGQVAKHYDEEKGKNMYYLYFCSWNHKDGNKQSIGVAVSESPTGPFTDIGEALILGSFTTGETSAWNDIDPTVWIENDASGEEHIYLCWGNSKLFMCELNPDMVSVKDRNGDGKIVFGEDVIEQATPSSFTEAPWLYRRQDENGYYGPYYMFYAYGWREQLAYATTEATDLMSARWQYEKVIMPPTATSNTNHPAVFDFQGKTYMIYHNGCLPYGSGYRRAACIAQLEIASNGVVKNVEESAIGLHGTISTIVGQDGKLLAHRRFNNSSADADYPYKDILLGSDLKITGDEDAYWEIVAGREDASNVNYVSIESYNKPGLYITATSNHSVVLSQDDTGKLGKAQTFRTVEGLLDETGVSFESVEYPGYYLTLKEGEATLSDGSDKAACTFQIKTP